jgi:hypothetical protein
VCACLQMRGRDAREFQLGSDGSKLASTNGTFRVLDGNEKGELGQETTALIVSCCWLHSKYNGHVAPKFHVILGALGLSFGVELARSLLEVQMQRACQMGCAGISRAACLKQPSRHTCADVKGALPGFTVLL